MERSSGVSWGWGGGWVGVGEDRGGRVDKHVLESARDGEQMGFLGVYTEDIIFRRLQK